MSSELLELEIVSPEKMLFKGRVERVQVPGSLAPFVILYNHAPLVSTLSLGYIKWKTGDSEQMVPVKSGFVEVKSNKVTICVEQ